MTMPKRIWAETMPVNMRIGAFDTIEAADATPYVRSDVADGLASAGKAADAKAVFIDDDAPAYSVPKREWEALRAALAAYEKEDEA